VIYPVSAPGEEFLTVVRHLDAKEKWGFGGRMLNITELDDPRNSPEKVFTRCWQNDDDNMWEHELWRTKMFLEQCGFSVGDMTPQFWLSEKDHEFADLNMPKGKVLGVFPGSADRFKCWPVDKWKCFVSQQKVFKQVVIFGSDNEEELSGQIVQSAESYSVTFFNLAGKTTLRQLAACVKKCSCVVSTDSLGLHIAVAFGIPTVGLIGGHHLGRFYPWGNARINRMASIDCDGVHCNKKCIRERMSCVENIPVETVLREFKIAVDNSVLGAKGR
jgi:ADP-heptose:LPS heptosyltransferase